MLNPNEVFVVVRQSRLKPGGSKFTPDIIFANNDACVVASIYISHSQLSLLSSFLDS